jgi:hypothetical protein
MIDLRSILDEVGRIAGRFDSMVTRRADAGFKSGRVGPSSGGNAWQPAPSQDEFRRYHLTYKYFNARYGHENSGSSVVQATSLEDAARQIMAQNEHVTPELFVKQRHHQNGQTDEINRAFKDPQFKPPAAPAKKPATRRRKK